MSPNDAEQDAQLQEKVASLTAENTALRAQLDHVTTQRDQLKEKLRMVLELPGEDQKNPRAQHKPSWATR